MRLLLVKKYGLLEIMKKIRKKDEFLEHLRKIPIIQVAAEKSDLSRNTIYRWRKEDDKFRKMMAEALAEGEELINDLSEGQLLTLIKEKNWSALSFWLRNHHPKYADKLIINGNITNQDESLSPEQEKTLAKALALSSSQRSESPKNINDTISRQKVDKPDNQGSEDQNKTS